MKVARTVREGADENVPQGNASAAYFTISCSATRSNEEWMGQEVPHTSHGEYVPHVGLCRSPCLPGMGYFTATMGFQALVSSWLTSRRYWRASFRFEAVLILRIKVCSTLVWSIVLARRFVKPNNLGKRA